MYVSIFADPKILCLGLIQSLFEGSMYTFVLEWTPALTPKTADGHSVKIPHGYIFAAFMVSRLLFYFTQSGPFDVVYPLD